MTAAEERLLAAVERLAAHAAEVTLAHCDLHAGTGGAASSAKQDQAIVVAVDSVCRPCSTGTPGEVDVGITPTTHDVPIPTLPVEHVVAGVLPMSKHDAVAPGSIPAGSDHVVVRLPPNSPMGLYLGELRDATGAWLSSFCIYVDGLA